MITMTGGPGISLRTAFKIHGAADNLEGIHYEYEFMNRCFSIINKKWRLFEQCLYHIGEKSFDRLIVQDEDGKVSSCYFNITEFFGKW